MKKWKLILAFVVLLAAVALGMVYLKVADEADPSQRPAAPLVWLAKAMNRMGLDTAWSREVELRELAESINEFHALNGNRRFWMMGTRSSSEPEGSASQTGPPRPIRSWKPPRKNL